MDRGKGFLNDYAGVCSFLDGLTKGQVREIVKTPGGRTVSAVSYGDVEPIERRANLSAALSAGDLEAYQGKEHQKKVLLVCAAVHGAEMESIAGVMNLISLLERGCDLEGEEWPRLLECAHRLRLVIVPVANPDGRARIPSDDPLSWSEEEMERYRHGLNAAGEPNGWMPGCFSPHPRPPGVDAVMGGYFNDAGVNPSHGIFLDRSISPEIHALADLADAEVADCLLDLHSCSAGPFFIHSTQHMPQALVARQSYFDGVWRTKMRLRGLPAPTWTTRSQRPVMGSGEWIYHRTGALPLLFEGGSGDRYSGERIHRQIVETYLLLLETVCEIGVEEGFKAGD